VPKICVSKGVICSPAGPNPTCDPNQTYLKQDIGMNGAAFCYRVIVRNCSGNGITLTNLTVVDSVKGPLTGFSAPLADGQSETNVYSLTWAGVPTGASTNDNTVTATGIGNGIIVTTNDTARAIVVPIGVSCSTTLSSPNNLNTNNTPPCQVVLSAPGVVTVNFTINNTGQGDLSVQMNGLPQLNDCTSGAALVLNNPTNIPAGQSITIVGCMHVDCGGTNLNLSVQGTAIANATTGIVCIYDSSGQPLTTAVSQCPACVTVQCAPKICVFKGVTCGPMGSGWVTTCDPNQSYFSQDIGVNGAQFCYRVIVQNCSGNGVTITNLNVVDTVAGPLTGFTAPLADGQSETNTYPWVWNGSPDGATTNVNTVTATGIGNGFTVSNNASATAIVVPIGVNCTTVLSSDFNLNTNGTGPCPVVLPSGGTNPVTLTLTINNTGLDDLAVQITGLPALNDCETGLPMTIDNPTTVPAGGSVTIVGCVDVACPGGANWPIAVQGTALVTDTIKCIWGENGAAITTSVSQCPACVACAQGVLCRVTGGGVLMAGTTSGVSNEFCIVYTTTLNPTVNGTGLVLDKITHGGQIGAPFSAHDCGEILGNPCIRGQWEHVRHYKGSGNPRDVVTAFHTTTPKGQFDTLNCACLGCCDGAGTFFPAFTGPGHIKKFALCNPDDHKVCGPMPRPSPANAIIITGIGQLTPTTDTGTDKKNTQWVVYRIYIEDRSEPGGAHPGGQVTPADVYCFQAWYTGISTSKKPDYSKIEPAFRAALGADSCAFLDGLNTGAIPMGSLPPTTVSGQDADIVDMGPMYDGNHQIHPATGATCK
jgi:hypothetical protein